ncbi:MAG TPA: PBP1A family penicillin-binding protein [Vicinamibacterales bacterium]|nr:PBP1A family penicillin-binding protein [Vicinamibacterales bacterium]
MRRTIFIGTVVLISAALWAAAAVGLRTAWAVAGELAHADSLAEIGSHPQTTIVYDRHQRPAFRFFFEQRIDVPLDRVSPHMVHALLAVEDRRFFSHHGLDPLRIVKAAYRNWRRGRIVEGGSTITQQLARLEQLSPERTLSRKLREAAIAVRLEERYSKQQILRAYLNAVYFGDGYYGVEAASRGYFGKPAAELLPHEGAMLAALVRSPSGYSPTAAPQRALARRNLVLRLMQKTGRLSEAQYREAVAMPLPASAGPAALHAHTSCGGYFQEEVRRQLVARLGVQQVMKGGLRVHTGYDPAMQCAAEETITRRVTQIARTRKSARDLQGSLVALDPMSGEVRALVGGRDFAASSYIRATQARRQPGSAFKPIIFAAALERGMAPGSMLHHLDEPIMTEQGPWLPGGEHEASEYTLRAALKMSSNRAAAQLLQQVGYSQATYYAQRLGIESQLPSVASLALGTGGVTLLELTAAYGVFANRGAAVAPHLIVRVEDGNGRTIYSEPPTVRQAVTPATAYLMSSMLADVIASGTAAGARSAGFKLPAAGKTGTTDNYADAWFVGYTPHLVTGVWFGLDTPGPIMSRGFASVIAVPAWAEFMAKATAGDRPDWFTPPADVEKVTICRLSGQRATEACRHGWFDTGYVMAGLPALPGASTPAGSSRPTAKPPSNVYDDYFPYGTAPTGPCGLHAMPAVPGFSGTAESVSTGAAAVSASHTGSAMTGARLQKVVGGDGRAVWVIR